jgi:predicted secreted protein
VSQSLGAESYRLLDLSINSGASVRPIIMQAEAVHGFSQSAVAEPAFEPGTSRVTVEVSGSIQLVRELKN